MWKPQECYIQYLKKHFIIDSKLCMLMPQDPKDLLHFLLLEERLQAQGFGYVLEGYR